MQYLFSAMLGAAFAAICAYFFNARLARRTREWESKRHVVLTAERFCDELMALAVEYWSEKSSDETDAKSRLSVNRIAAYNHFLYCFLRENFPRNADILEKFGRMAGVVAGGNFGAAKREPDAERVALSVAAIVDLRLATSRPAKTKNSQ